MGVRSKALRGSQKSVSRANPGSTPETVVLGAGVVGAGAGAVAEKEGVAETSEVETKEGASRAEAALPFFASFALRDEAAPVDAVSERKEGRGTARMTPAF